MTNTQSNTNVLKTKSNFSKVMGRVMADRWLYIMLLPCVVYFLIFRYGPMFGLVMAFENYQPFLGFFKSQWVGFDHFRRFFADDSFFLLLKNTVLLGTYNLVFFFPLPIIISLMLNELRNVVYQRVVQTLIYIPHFLSWVVVASLTVTLFNTNNGAINNVIASIIGHKINILSEPGWFKTLLIGQTMWKETGWGTIIFLAALTGIDPELYNAAKIDGANRWQQLWAITFPAIKTTVVTLLILRLGHFLNTGFEQIFLMINPLNRNAGEVFDTYVYTMGIQSGQMSYSAAVGLFKSIASLVLVLTANKIAKKAGEEGIY